MSGDNYDFSRINIYDLSLFGKVNQEEILKRSHLNFLKDDLVIYEKYISFTEEYLDTEGEKLQSKHLDSLNNDNFNLSDYYAEEMFELDKNFVQIFRESMVAQLYSFFEKSIINSCIMYDLRRELNNFSLEKPGFDDVKKFLKNTVGIKLDEINNELDFFDKLRALRNRIVHHKTEFFTDDTKNLNKIRALSRNRFLLIEHRDFITTYFIYFDNPKFALEIIHKIKSLYSKLGENGFYY